MRELALSVLIACGLASVAFADDENPLALGRAPDPIELSAKMISVAPDGVGLPKAHGSVREGRAVYEKQCAACHGARGEGIGEYPALVGGNGSLTSKDPVLTVGSYWPFATTVWDYINRAMPYQDAGSLSPSEVYAVTAYVLFLNGIVRESRVLDSRSLPLIRMPNRDGFIDDPRPDVAVGLSTVTQAVKP